MTSPRCPRISGCTDVAVTVLYDPNVLGGVLIRLAQTRLVHPRWTEPIPDESFDNLGTDRPGIPAAALTGFDIQALHPDEFVMDLFTLDGARAHPAISATAAA